MRKLGKQRGRLLLLLFALPIISVLLSSRKLHATVPCYNNNNDYGLSSETSSTSTSPSATAKVKGIRVVALCVCSADSGWIEKWKAVDTAVSSGSFVCYCARSASTVSSLTVRPTTCGIENKKAAKNVRSCS
mmetsp:Transcript_10126/g.23693  ORF Transcript_10126/g.23693 Transcript_10126/m.23693 type:complete len:132 (+) Transcript_10126:53-448(+)